MVATLAAPPLAPPVAMDPTVTAMMKTCNRTALEAAEATAAATEEEEYDDPG